MPENQSKENVERRNKAFLKAVDSLKLKSPNKQLVQDLEFSKGNISRILNGRQDVSDNLAESFETFYNLDLKDFEEDEEPPINILHEPKATEYRSNQNIPLYGIEATAGVVSLLRDPKSHKPIDTIRIPNMPNCDGAITVTGDSMYPLIKSGDIVLYKSITDIPQSVFFGNMYLVSIDVEGDEMVMVKYVQRGKDENHIMLVSENKHHADKEIHIKYINAMALVKANIRFNTLT